jgi:RimJ/RimL family protein N-acetyltransferase
VSTNTGVVEATPADRRRVDAFLETLGEELPPGRSFVAWHDGVILAACRVASTDPGDGYHREHVRTIHLAGDAASLESAACCATEAVPADTRLEAWITSRQVAEVAALERAGLRVEVRLPEALDEGAVDLVGLGREPQGRRGVVAVPGVPRRDAAPARGDVSIAWHDATTRAALARFLAHLVPGRAYPAGALLSEADRLETSRRGALDAAWLLAFDGAGEVAGGLVLERPRARAHVRRLHLDVLPAWQGRGVATGLLRAAVDGARARLGASRLESDPRAGNEGACGAMERAGFTLAGTQLGAWRLRVGGRCVDEDVRFYAASAR